MGDVIPFGKKPIPKRSILCLNNHHKWEVVNEREFDVKQGKLVTQERCVRCKIIRNKLT